MSENRSEIRISVIGAGRCGQDVLDVAESVGAGIAARGWALVCGGLGGVMAAAAKGACDAGGQTIGIVPGLDPADANPYIQTSIATGLGQMRNLLVIANGDAAIAVEGGNGTLSEIALALKHNKPVVAIGAWKDVPGVIAADGPEHALELAEQAVRECPEH